MAAVRPAFGFWVCTRGHIFEWGSEFWHVDASRDDGAPRSCPADLEDGEICDESSHLWGPFGSPEDARAHNLPIVVDDRPAPVRRAEAYGHRVFADGTTPNGAQRWTCTRCGMAALLLDHHIYGSAVEHDCWHR